ncbi:MAG: prolyl oligopeptidase family serine peptidase [Candidatus Micrarchaeota archaeon]|nr:prolyl oligopeptidase family serine peptidase [Candidatus Micrarchaeota archaeon]
MRKEILAGACALFALWLLAGCLTSNSGPAAKTESVQYASGNFTVNGLLCQPANPSGKAVAVVLTGGDGVSLGALRPVCETFAGLGLTALAHDNVNGTIGDNVQAVADALAYLQNRFPSMPRALWAHSSGTIYSAFAAYEQRNITAFVETSGHFQIPLCDRPSDNPPPGGCAAYLEDFPAPVLVVHGAADNVVNVSYANAFASRLLSLGIPYNKIIVPGAGHEFMTDRAWVADDEAAFIRQQPYNETADS